MNYQKKNVVICFKGGSYIRKNSSKMGLNQVYTFLYTKPLLKFLLMTDVAKYFTKVPRFIIFTNRIQSEHE